MILHPSPAARLQIVRMDPGHSLVAYGRPDEEARAAGKPWIAASWLFFVESLGDLRSRLVSRYRAAYSNDLATRLAFGPALLEPVGFAMDRRMLLEVKKLVERAGAGPAERRLGLVAETGRQLAEGGGVLFEPGERDVHPPAGHVLHGRLADEIGAHTVFVSGNDAGAKQKVIEILESFGWKDIFDLGDITTARGTEMILPLWVRIWGATKNPMFQFKLVR